MKMVSTLLSLLLSAQSFAAGYVYGSGNDQERVHREQSGKPNQEAEDATQAQSVSAPTGSRKRGQSIFSVEGIVVGTSTRSDLNAVKAGTFDYVSYSYRGQNFWYNLATDKVYSLTLPYRVIDRWPSEWTIVGFQRYLSYQGFVNWLESSGFLTIKSYNHLEATMVTNHRTLIVKLDFIDSSQVSDVILLSTPRVTGRGY